VALQPRERGDAGPDRGGLTQARGCVENAGQRARHVSGVERADEVGGVPELPSATAAHEASQLLLDGLTFPGRLLLESAEGLEVTVGFDDAFDRNGSMRTNELVFQVSNAHVEPESLHVGAAEVGAKPGPLETAPEFVLLLDVAEPGEPEVLPPRAVPLQEASDGLRASHRQDEDPFGLEIPTPALGKGFDRLLVADPFDEYDRMHEHSRMHADELQIDERLVRGLLAEQFPEWAELPIEPVFPWGTDNALFWIHGDLDGRNLLVVDGRL
jgi:hypothetical protein